MRFIQCARYKEEQNMTVFQYCGNIYYRAFRHIPAGRELLVWYDEKYSEFIDVPAMMKARIIKGKNCLSRLPYSVIHYSCDPVMVIDK